MLLAALELGVRLLFNAPLLGLPDLRLLGAEANHKNRFIPKNQPVPNFKDKLSRDPVGKRIMSRSMVLHVVFERLWPDWWFSDMNGQQNLRLASFCRS